jgi:uncharacterized membrane protein
MPSNLRAGGRVGVFPENIAGALAYVTVIPAILFLVLEPYKRNRFVRFHSFQCLFFAAASVIISAVLKVVGWVLLIIPVIGQLFLLLISVVVGIAILILWLILVVKALQGEAFRLPVLGDLAEQQASRVEVKM